MKKSILSILLSFILLSIMNNYTMPQMSRILMDANYTFYQQPILDVRLLGYDVKDVEELFYHLGQEGRQIYQNQQLLLDIFYPFFFLIGFAGFFLQMITQSIGSLKLAKVGFWLTVFSSFTDWSENLILFLQLKNYPNLNSIAIQFCNGFTMTKLILIFVVHILFLFFGFLYFRKYRHG